MKSSAIVFDVVNVVSLASMIANVPAAKTAGREGPDATARTEARCEPMSKKREFAPGVTPAQQEALRALRRRMSEKEARTRAETAARIQRELRERREMLRKNGATKKQIAEADEKA